MFPAMSMPMPSGGMTGGAGGSARADATGGMLSTTGATFNNSGFTVNYAPAVGVGGGSMPSWIWIAAAVMGVVWLRKGR